MISLVKMLGTYRAADLCVHVQLDCLGVLGSNLGSVLSGRKMFDKLADTRDQSCRVRFLDYHSDSNLIENHLKLMTDMH
eukprot:2287917-Amphidinium_carterae.1